MGLTITLLTSASLAASTPSPAVVQVSTGLPGPQGPQGPSGAAATISIGSVSSVPYGTAPTVNNSGTSSAAVFNFQLETGPQGIQGPQGVPGPAGVNTWGSITGSISSQTDLQSALNGKYSTSNPAGYITSAALSGYATQSFVTSQGYITSSALTPYLLSSTASSTYQTKAPSNGNYYIQQNGSWVVVTVY